MRWRRWIAPFAALGLSGCLSAPPGGGVDADPDAGDPGDAGSDACGPVLFADTFAGSELGVAWDPSKSNDPQDISVTGERMVLDATATEMTGYRFTAVFTALVFDADEVTLTADVAVEIGGQGDAFLGWWDAASDEYIGIRASDYGEGARIAGTQGVLEQGGADLCADPACPFYAASSSPHWRLRGADGQIHFETSADRVTWTALGEPVAAPPYQPAILAWAECEVDNSVAWIADAIAVHDCSAAP